MRIAGFAAIITWQVLVPAVLRADEVFGRAAVGAALRQVDVWTESSEHGTGWQVYLGSDALRRELGQARPDLAVLRQSLRRLTNEKALTVPPLSELRRALQGWLAWECLPADRQLVSVANSILRRSDDRSDDHRRAAARLTSLQPGVRPNQQLRARLTALLALLPLYADRPTEELAAAIDGHLCWLEDTKDAEPLVAAIRRYYSHPNIWCDVSEDFLEQSVVQRIDRWEDVRNVILGTPVSGRGRLRATSDLMIEPHAEQARLRIVLTGTLDTDTVGHTGPARISTQAVTSFRVEKQLLLNGAGLTVLPAVCVAQTRAVASDVAAARRGLGAGLVRRVAERRWQAVRSEAERESARQAEAQLTAAVDQEADDLIKKLNRVALAPVLAMVGGDTARTRVRFCSETRMLRIGAIYGPLGAPPNRPAHQPSRVFTLHVHSGLMDRLKGGVASGPCFAIGAEWWNALVWKGVEKVLSPGLTPYGIALRNGEWGTLVPVSLAGEWLAVEWRAGPPQPRWAEAAAPHLD